MSGRINRVNDALTDSGIKLIETISPVADAIHESASILKYGAQGGAIFMKDWRDAQEDLAAVRKLERALTHDERLRAVTLNREAFDALPETS